MGTVCYGRSEGYWTWYVIARIVVNVIFLILFLLITLFYLHTLKRKYAARQTATFWGYGLALVFMLLYYLISIVADSLYACSEIYGEQYLDIGVATDIFASLSFLWILGVILFPLSLNVLEHAHQPVKMTRILHSILMFLLSVLLVAGQALLNKNVLSQYLDDTSYSHGAGPVNATYSALYFVASVVGTVTLLRARGRMQGMAGVQASGLSTWLPFTVIFQLLSAILNLIIVFVYSISLTYESTIVAIIIAVLSNALSVGVLMCAGSPALTTSGPDFTYDPLTNAVSSKYDPVNLGGANQYDPVQFNNQHTAYKADPEGGVNMESYPQPRQQGQFYEFPSQGPQQPQQVAMMGGGRQGYVSATQEGQRYEPYSH